MSKPLEKVKEVGKKVKDFVSSHPKSMLAVILALMLACLKLCGCSSGGDGPNVAGFYLVTEATDVLKTDLSELKYTYTEDDMIYLGLSQSGNLVSLFGCFGKLNGGHVSCDVVGYGMGWFGPEKVLTEGSMDLNGDKLSGHIVFTATYGGSSVSVTEIVDFKAKFSEDMTLAAEPAEGSSALTLEAMPNFSRPLILSSYK